MHSAEMRRCLVECDTAGIRLLWRTISPGLPQPESDAAALAGIHHARTQANSIPSRLRFYSHRWLLDHGLPSGLPDHLKPSAERVYPVVVEGVGISCNAKNELFKPITKLVRRAMEDAVSDAYADGRKEPPFVAARMSEARVKTVKKLIGIVAA